jgi:hypothetical protein
LAGSHRDGRTVRSIRGLTDDVIDQDGSDQQADCRENLPER